MNGNDLTLAHYATARGTEELADYGEDFTIISFWRPNDAMVQG